VALLLAAPAARAQPAGVAPVPRPRREKIPPAPPGDRYVWQPGTWEWLETEGRYDWRHGRYVARRPGTTTFVGGRWVQEAGVWVWRRGRWK
jgi:hypothetical protein